MVVSIMMHGIPQIISFKWYTLHVCVVLESIVTTVLSVRFEVGASLLLAPAGADKRGTKAPFPPVENAGIQPAIRKRVPAGALAGAGSC